MSINIGDNFSYLGKKFLDNRQSFDTLELMNNCSDVPLGFITFCKEDNKRYEYSDSGWIEYKSSITDEEAEKLNVAYLHSQSEHLQLEDITGFATEEFVMNKIAEAELGGEEVDLSGYVSKEELEGKGYLTGIPEEYVTDEELNAKGYLTEHQDLSDYATKDYVDDAISNIDISGGGNVDVDLSGYVTDDELDAALDGKFDDVEVNEAESNDTQTALDFYSNGEVVKTVYFSGGGGGATNVPPYISTMLPENSILGLGEIFDLQLDFSSSVTGRGTLKIFINDVEIRSVSIPQGENVIPVEDIYFTKGTNRLVIYVIDRTGAMSNSLTFYVRYGSLEITSDFDAYSSYDYGAVVRYYFTPTAVDTSLTLTMYMNIDGEVKPGVSCSSDTRGYYTFPSNLGVGAHYCQAYVVDSGGNTSNILAFNLVILDDTSLVIASDTVNPSVEEGSQLVLDYKVYMKGNTSFITKTYVDNNLVNTGTCGLAMEYYRTSSLREGIHTIKMEVFDVTETVSDYIIWTVTITPSTYDMLEPVTAGAMFIGSARNMTNSSENKEIWAGVDQDGNAVNGILNNFAFNSENGWVNDEILMTGISSVEIPITPLANNARYGFTLDLEFASKAIGVEDALVLKLWDEIKDCGIKITTEKVILRSAEGNECDLYFTDDEMTSVMFVIDRNEATAKIYLNGVMCSAFHLSDYTIDGVPYLEDFSVDSTIMLGGSGHARIKNLRVYQVALTTDEILNNFMANETDKMVQQELVAFQKGDHLPTLTVYCDFSGLGKDDKKPCSITYLSTDEEKYGKSFTLSHKKSSLQYQGTSSMAYPIKNYRLNLADEQGNKWRYDFPFGKPEYRYTLKADFMSSGHWTNTGLTKWINKNLYNYDVNDEKTMNPKKWYDINNGGSLDDTRECIYGFPCRLILVNDGNTPLNEGQNEPTPGNTKDMGIFNFNHDKDATDTMGFDDDVFPNCASYEVTANSDTSAGAFMSYKGEPGNFTTGGICETTLAYVNGGYYTSLFPIELFDGLTTITHEIWTTYTIGVDANFNEVTQIQGVNPNLSDVIVEGVEYIRFCNYKESFAVNEVTITAKEILDHVKPNDIAEIYTMTESGELDYIKQSFELRFPDEDDVPEGWGFMGVMKTKHCIDYWYESTIVWSSKFDPVDYFGTNELTVETKTGANFTVFGFVTETATVGIVQNVPSGTTFTVTNVSSIMIRALDNSSESITINGIEFEYANNITNINNGFKDPYDVTYAEEGTGLKALIDWVDGCSDEEFVRDFEDHFHKDYTLRYFLLVITLGMVDNLGKNMMFDTWDNKIFMPRFYDCDTICSYDNSGQLKFDVDIEMAQGYWNTSSSRLWTRVRDLFHDELVAKYNNMRQNGLSYESLMECFYDEQIAKIPQKYYNMDYDVKYAPFADSYIGMANGDVYEHVKRWLQQRLRFVDTLYDYAPSYNNDVLTIRANTTEPMTLEIETYTPVYQHLSWYNNQMDKKKIDGKIAVSFTGTAMAATDQEVLIYGGSNIKKIRGISSMNPNRMLIGSATRLIELEAPNCPLLADVNSNKANFAPHIYLNKLDISGCPLLGGNLIINNSPLIREIDIRGTAITGLNLPPSLRNLEIMRLPAAISTLNLNDAGQLHTMEFEEGVNLQSVSMTNCNALVNTINFDFKSASSVTLNNSYNTAQELYFRDTTNISLSNMPNLERVVFTPNDEYEVFNKGYLATRPDYKITTFNAPKCTEFLVTAPYRNSYNIYKYEDVVVPEEVTNPELSWIQCSGFTATGGISPLGDGKGDCIIDPTYYRLIPGQTYKFTTNGTWFYIASYDTSKKFIKYIHQNQYGEECNYTCEQDMYVRLGAVGTVANNNLQLIGRVLADRIESLPVKDYGDIKPNTVFSANSIDISGTRFTDVKLLSTTDTNSLKLPSTAKNFIADSAHDIDTEVLPDATYETIHGDLIEPYTTDYEDEIKLYKESNISINSSLFTVHGWYDTQGRLWAEGSYYSTDFIPILPSTTIQNNNNIYSVIQYTKDKEYIKGYSYYSTNNYQNVTTDANCYYVKFTAINADRFTGNLPTWSEETPNVVPSSSDGSIIYSINSEQEGVWNLDGMEFDNFYTYGMNNDVKMVDGKLTMPRRDADYKVTIENANIEPKELPTMLYPKFINTDSPIKGTVDYSEYEGDSLDWAAAYLNKNEVDFIITDEVMLNATSQYNMNKNSEYKIVDPKTILIYTCSSSGVLPSFGSGFSGYSTTESANDDGTYTVSIISNSADNMPGWISFNGKSTLLSVEYLNFSKVTNINNLFNGCSNLTSVDVSKWDISKVTNFQSAFNNCKKLTSLDVSNWDTSQVGTMLYAFQNCSGLTTLDVSNWDTRNVNNMSGLFNGCSSLTSLDVSKWDTNKVTKMNATFNNCSSLTTLDVSNWDTRNVTDMSAMFYSCSALENIEGIGNWDVRKVSSTESMFRACTGLTELDLSGWTMEASCTISFIFQASGLQRIDLSGWNVDVITNRTQVFYQCGNLQELRVDDWPLTDTTQAIINTLPVGNDTKNEIYASVYFEIPSGWTIINPLDIVRITTKASGVLPNFDSSYTGFTSLETDNGDGTYTVAVATDSLDHLPTLISFNNKADLLTVEYINTDNLKNMADMFVNCSSLTYVNCSDWNTKNVGSMHFAFKGCSSLTSLDVSKWNTSNVTTMESMFNSCSSLVELDMSSWDTGKVTKMNGMFQACSSLKKLKGTFTLPGTGVGYMFHSCSKAPDLSEFKLAGTITDSNYMFFSFGYGGSETFADSVDLSNVICRPGVAIYSYMFFRCVIKNVYPPTNLNTAVNISNAGFSAEVIVRFLNNLIEVPEGETYTLTMSANDKNKLTEEQLAIAVNKGWTVA